MSLWTKTDNEAGKPKYLNETEKAKTFGVDVVEAQQTENRSKGIKTPGWTEYSSYTNAQGVVRNKNETLVALSSISGDADSLPPVPVITIDTQPVDVTVTEGATAEFSVSATATRSAVLSYQWQKQEGGAGEWANITNATAATYTTGALNVANDNGDKYRAIVSATLGATPVTSNAVTLTVNASVITIDTQPADATAAEGETATFNVAATATGGATLSYQWEVSTDDGATWTEVAGATTDSYETDTLVAGQDGDQYRVVVSATNEATPITSDAATLTVTSV